MSDVELIVKIPEEEYKRLPYIDIFKLRGYIENGITLPKGHGRLIDADAVLEEPFGNTYKDIDIAETIIEANKE